LTAGVYDKRLLGFFYDTHVTWLQLIGKIWWQKLKLDCIEFGGNVLTMGNTIVNNKEHCSPFYQASPLILRQYLMSSTHSC